MRTYEILSDGRRQIGGFYLPGDIFGLESADEHTLSAEAITDAKTLEKLWKSWKLPGDHPRAYAVYVDDKDKVWLSDFSANAIVRFDPLTEKFTAFPSDRSGANVRQLDGRPGEVWGCESGNDRLVVIRTLA